jgi:hypothetical protein
LRTGFGPKRNEIVGEIFKMMNFIICAPLRRVFQNRMPGRIFESNRNEVIGSWRKIKNEALHNLYSFPNMLE